MLISITCKSLHNRVFDIIVLVECHLAERFRNTLKTAWSRYLTALLRITPALILILIWGNGLTACNGGVTATTPVEHVVTVTPTTTKASQGPHIPTVVKTPTRTTAPLQTPDADIGKLRGLTIRFWYVYPDVERIERGEDTLKSLVGVFNRTNTWGIQVVAIPFDRYEDLFQKLESLSSGDLPNLIVGYSDQVAALDGRTHLIVDLAPYLSDPRWGFPTQEVQDFYPLFWDQDKVADKRVGLPFYRYAQVLFYNLTWAKELGFNVPPTSVEEFSTQACAAMAANRYDKDPLNDGTGGWVINSEALTLASWIYSFKGEIVDISGKGYQINSNETRDAFTFLRGLYDAGCAWQDVNRYPNSAFVDRKALFITSSTSGISAQEAAFKDANSKDEWTVIPFPPPYGKPALVTYGPSLAAIKASSDKQLAAWLLAKWFVAPEQQSRWVERYGTWPVRVSAEGLLDQYKKAHPQWAASLKLLSYARNEPAIPSWSLNRWVLQDAGTQLFAINFSKADIPALLEMLNQTMNELDGQF